MTATPTATDTPEPTATATAFGAACGDGNLGPGEECDDGNQTEGDGCDNDCSVSGTCTLPVVHGAAELYVNDGILDGTGAGCLTPDFTTIQDAINAASDGDTIHVCPGAYAEALIVTAELALRSTDGAAVTTINSGSAITIDLRRSGTSVDGFTLATTGTAIDANSICPLAAPGCATPGERGSNLTITENIISGADVGIDWRGKIDCVSITGNAFSDNGQHVLLRQEYLVATPAVLVDVSDNTFDRGGENGIGLEVYGMQALMLLNRVSDAAETGVRIGGAVVRWASGIVERSGGTGILVENAPVGTQVLESEIQSNVGDGITIGPGGSGARVLNNNIQNNTVGLRNLDTSGVLDATINYWNSFTGPFHLTDRPFGLGDSIIDVAGADTLFIEFLCDRFPQGFPSVNGLCGEETSTLIQLIPGSWPDMTTGKGRFISFESPENLDIDPRTAASNPENTSEAFLLDRIPRRKIGGVCLGDPLQTICKTKRDCPPIVIGNGLVIEGSCGLFTQLSDTGDPNSFVERVRLSRAAKIIAFDRNVPNGLDPNDGGALNWVKKLFERVSPSLALSPVTPGNNGLSQKPQPNLGGSKLVIESTEDLTGENADGNWEIFLFDKRRGTWRQMTHTVAPVENRRPELRTGIRINFDSNGNLDNDPKTTISNADLNRELFSIRVSTKGGVIIISQLTDTQPPVENILGCTARGGRQVFYSSSADNDNDPATSITNTDGNREIFRFVGTSRKQTFTQLTNTIGGANTNPACTSNGVWIAFESTSDIDNDGAVNRRVYNMNIKKKTMLRLSRSRFGDNAHPRTTGRFVVWDSNANLTGSNPTNKRVIYLFDRRKD
jgi:cysteine-rich repeat protein